MALARYSLTQLTLATVLTSLMSSVLSAPHPVEKVSGTLPRHTCTHGEFACFGDGSCISSDRVCDFTSDCSDGSDEIDCISASDQPSVTHDAASCKERDGVWCDRCIHSAWVCDGEVDCPNAEDETNCTSTHRADDIPDGVHQTEATCVKGGGLWCGKCIHPGWLCDGTEDCSGGEDEVNCTQTATTCPLDSFQCINESTCLDAVRVCDGVQDCFQGSDEGVGCNRTDGCTVDSCAAGQVCRPLPSIGHVLCSCMEGYAMNNASVCQRVEPCGGCEYRCLSDHCVCPAGMMLAANNQSCDIDQQSAGSALLVTDGLSLQHMDLPDGNLHTVAAPADNSIITAIAADISGKSTVYWSMPNSDSTAVVLRRAAFAGGSAEVFVSGGLRHVSALAWEWITESLYIADAGYYRIAACDWRAACTVVIDNIQAWMLSIAVYPQQKMLLWSDATGRITRTALDGDHSADVEITGLGMPTSLAVDPAEERIYWTDMDRGVLESCRLDGSGRHEVPLVPRTARRPFSLALVGHRLFWSALDSGSVHSCDKKSGKHQSTVYTLHHVHQRPIKMLALHASLQPPLSNPCAGSHCSHLCLLSSSRSRGYRCFCGETMELSADGVTCVQGNFNQLIVARSNQLLSVTPNVLEARPVRPLNGFSVNDVTALTFDYLPNIVSGHHIAEELKLTLVYADASTGQIVGNELNGRHRRTLVQGQTRRVVAISADPIRGNIYWADSILGTVELVRADGRHRRLVVNGLHYLTGLSISARQRHLFVAVGGRTGNIQKMALDGSRRVGLVTAALLSPTSLCADDVTGRLFWVDPNRGMIESVKYDGEGRRTEKSHLSSPASLAVTAGEMYWTELYSNEIHWIKKENKAKNFKQSLVVTKSEANQSVLHKLTAIFSLRRNQLVAYRSMSACKSLQCPELCLYSSDEYCACGDSQSEVTHSESCKQAACLPGQHQCGLARCLKHAEWCDGIPDCPSGEDELNCTSHEHAEVCTPHHFHCATDTLCVSWALRCDGVARCTDGSDEMDCDLGACPRGEFRCGTGVCLPQHERCNGHVDCADASDERGCHLPRCAATDRRCDDGRCVGAALWCDRVPDCADGSDEGDACRYTNAIHDPARVNESCPVGQRPCEEGSCIEESVICDGKEDCPAGEDEDNCANIAVCPKEDKKIPQDWLCDDEADCQDGWDERLALCANISRTASVLPGPTRLHCRQDQLRCADGSACVDLAQACDGVFDCRDHSDEGGQCDTACSRNLCEDKGLCRSTPHRPICGCANGLRLRNDERTCEDIDECVDDYYCWYLCNNTHGSYRCSCPPGFWLNTDGVSCRAIDSPSLLLSHVNRVVTDEVRRQHFDLVYRNDHATLKFSDFDTWTGMLYFYDAYQGGVFVIPQGTVYDATSPPARLLMSAKDENITSPTAMALDWTTKAVYIANRAGDNGLLRICISAGVCRVLSEAAGEVITQIRPVPEHGRILVCTETVRTAKNRRRRSRVLSMHSDGSDWKVLEDHKLDRCSGLDLDRSTGRVWWIDGHLNRMASVLMDGTNRRQLRLKQLVLPRNLAVFEDWAYLINHFTHVQRCHTRLTKDNDLAHFRPLTNMSNGFCESVYNKHMVLTFVDVVHHLRQPLLKEMPLNGSVSLCTVHRCRYLCVAAAMGVRCLCPDHNPNCEPHLDFASASEQGSTGGTSGTVTAVIVLLIGLAVGLVGGAAYWRRWRPLHTPPKVCRTLGRSREPSTPQEPILNSWPAGAEEQLDCRQALPSEVQRRRDSLQSDDSRVEGRVRLGLGARGSDSSDSQDSGVLQLGFVGFSSMEKLIQ